ncbi:MAG: hypothetical protein HYY18_05850 [Planctomycetes bacterium]|nr:hypothetical protein [Planctomycetota bacterium]
MEFRYSPKRLWLLPVLACVFLAGATARFVLEYRDGRLSAWDVASDGLFAALSIFMALVWLRLRNSSWVVRLTPGGIRIRGWQREETHKWDDLADLAAARSAGQEKGSVPMPWGAHFSSAWNAPWLDIGKRWVVNGETLDAIVAFYVANPGNRSELDDPQACAARLTEIRSGNERPLARPPV